MADRFVLEAIDPKTNCVALDLAFEAGAARLAALLHVDARSLRHGESCNVETDELDLLQREFGFSFDAGSLEVRLRGWRPIDGLPYKIHTNRELILMLEGRKPFAAFCLEPDWNGDEEYFAPHVASGKFIRREHEYPDGGRYALYALPGEEWRIDAYIAMQDQARESGWSEALERREGQLLGYEDWQNDVYIETIYRRARNAS